MEQKVKTSTPQNTMVPVGPYSHIARVGDWISISGTAGVDPSTGKLAGADAGSQTTQILSAFEVMLASVNSDLNHIVHINVFLKNMDDFEAMNVAYEARMGSCRPARTTVAVVDLPKPDALLTMNLSAVTIQ